MYRHRIRIGRAELVFIGPVAQHARGVMPWVIEKQGKSHSQRALDFLIDLLPKLGIARIAQPTKYRRPEIAVVPKACHPSTRPDKPNRAVVVMDGTQGA